VQPASLCILPPHNFCFSFKRKKPLNPTRNVLGGVGITFVNTFIFLSELSSASIASFHLFQSERFLHYAMILGSGSLRKFSVMTVEKHMFAIVVLRSYTSLELV
jgi:hypothetical protein